MAYIVNFNEWNSLPTCESFDRIFEQRLRLLPGWAKLTRDAIISGTPATDYKLILVKSTKFKCSVYIKGDDYDVVEIHFDALVINKQGSNMIAGDGGGQVMYAKSSEPWYLYHLERFDNKKLDTSSKMYCKNGGIITSEIKNVSRKNLVTNPTGLPAEIQGDTLNWAKTDKQIEDLTWGGDKFKGHLFAWMHQEGKIEDIKTLMNAEISKNTGKFKLTIKNPGIKAADTKPEFEKVEESRLFSRINESNTQVAVAKGKKEDGKKEGDKDVDGPFIMWTIIDQFEMGKEENEESPRVKKWIDKQIEDGLSIRCKFKFTKDTRDFNILYSMERLLDDVEVTLDTKTGRLKVFIDNIKAKTIAVKNTVLDLKDDKTYKSELEESRKMYKMLNALRGIYGELKQIGEKPEKQVEKRIKVILNSTQLPNLTLAKKELKNKHINRFKEIYTPIYTGYSKLRDIFGKNEDVNIFDWASPNGRRALLDVRLAYKEEKISERNYNSYVKLLYRWDIEKQNKEIDEHNAELARRKEANKSSLQRGFEKGFGVLKRETKKAIKTVRTANKQLIAAENAMVNYFNQSMVGQGVGFIENNVIVPAAEWTAEWTKDNVIDPVKAKMYDKINDASAFFEKIIVTPMGVYLNLDITEATVTEITNPDQTGNKNGYVMCELKSVVSYKIKTANKKGIKSGDADLNIKVKANYDIDLDTKAVTILGISIAGITMDWLEVLLSPIDLKFKLRYASGRVFVDIKTKDDFVKDEGDDWWELYDKLSNKIHGYTKSIDITGELRKGISSGVTKIKPIDLKKLGIESLPV